MVRLTEKDASRPYKHQAIAKTEDIFHWRYDQGYLFGDRNIEIFM